MEEILRSIREFFNKSLKCERLGHDCIDQPIKIRKEPEDYAFRVVVEDYKATVQWCQRCREIQGEPKDLEHITHYNSCSMPNSMWDSIREKGYVILD